MEWWAIGCEWKQGHCYRFHTDHLAKGKHIMILESMVYLLRTGGCLCCRGLPCSQCVTRLLRLETEPVLHAQISPISLCSCSLKMQFSLTASIAHPSGGLCATESPEIPLRSLASGQSRSQRLRLVPKDWPPAATEWSWLHIQGDCLLKWKSTQRDEHPGHSPVCLMCNQVLGRAVGLEV